MTHLCFYSLVKIVGFAIGVIPQIRNLMIGDGAPLRVIQDTTNLLGYITYTETVPTMIYPWNLNLIIAPRFCYMILETMFSSTVVHNDFIKVQSHQ